MILEIDLPDNIAEFLKNIAALQKCDPDMYIREYVQNCVKEMLRSHIDTIGLSVFFDPEALLKRYGLE